MAVNPIQNVVQGLNPNDPSVAAMAQALMRAQLQQQRGESMEAQGAQGTGATQFVPAANAYAPAMAIKQSPWQGLAKAGEQIGGAFEQREAMQKQIALAVAMAQARGNASQNAISALTGAPTASAPALSGPQTGMAGGNAGLAGAVAAIPAPPSSDQQAGGAQVLGNLSPSEMGAMGPGAGSAPSGPPPGLADAVAKSVPAGNNPLLKGISYVESRGNPNALGPMLKSGEQAQGQYQILPSTARDPGYGINPLGGGFDGKDVRTASPEEQARFAQDYATKNPQGLAGYNAGPTRAAQGNLPAETQAYVPAVNNAIVANGGNPQAYGLGGVPPPAGPGLGLGGNTPQYPMPAPPQAAGGNAPPGVAPPPAPSKPPGMSPEQAQFEAQAAQYIRNGQATEDQVKAIREARFGTMTPEKSNALASGVANPLEYAKQQKQNEENIAIDQANKMLPIEQKKGETAAQTAEGQKAIEAQIAQGGTVQIPGAAIPVQLKTPAQLEGEKASSEDTGKNVAEAQKAFTIMQGQLPGVLARLNQIRQNIPLASSGPAVGADGEGPSAELSQILKTPTATANANLRNLTSQGVIPEIQNMMGNTGMKGNKFLESTIANAGSLNMADPPDAKYSVTDNLQDNYVRNMKASAAVLRANNVAGIPSDADIDKMVAQYPAPAGTPKKKGAPGADTPVNNVPAGWTVKIKGQ